MGLLMDSITYLLDTLKTSEALQQGSQNNECFASAVAETGLGKSFLILEPVLIDGEVSGSMWEDQCMELCVG